MEKIAVIILNYNYSSDCAKCVSYIKLQERVKCEIIIVDNCSDEGDLENLRELCAIQDCTLLQSSINRGYSAGNNIGLRYAAENNYKYALIINPDVELRQLDYLYKITKKMEEDDQIAICGSDIIDSDGIHQNPLNEATFWEELLWPFDIIRHKYCQGNYFVSDYTQSGVCEKLSGCCLVINMPFCQSIGFLDENTFLYCEEPILAKQAQKEHMKLYYMHDIQAVHMHIRSEKGNPRKRNRIFDKSRIYYIRHYSGYNRLCMQLLILSRKIHTILFG